MQEQDHWAALARRIGRMGPPQVPGPGIVAQVNDLCGGCPGVTVLLGVTPAYAGLGRDLRAFDGSAGMIAAVWPGDTPTRRATLADWTALPLADGAVSQVVGDGSLNALPDRAVLRAVLGEVRRVLHPQGRAALRVYVRPEPEETVEQVLHLARCGGIEGLDALRWRLAASLATGPGHSVPVADILSAAERLGDLARFASDRGWNPGAAEHFQAYRGLTARYLFPDRGALALDAAAEGLSCDWVETAGYPGAPLCPIALLRPL